MCTAFRSNFELKTSDSIPGFVDNDSEDFSLKKIGRRYNEEKSRGQAETALDDPVKPRQNR